MMILRWMTVTVSKGSHIVAQHCPHHCSAPAAHHVFPPSYRSCDSADVTVSRQGHGVRHLPFYKQLHFCSQSAEATPPF